MLLRFSVANYLSILEERELSLVSGRLKAPKDALRFSFGDVSVLPSALIYGPNASGKSNFIAALNFLRDAVLYSHSRGDPDGGVPRYPFALDPAAKERPSVFEADFVSERVRYQFGFEATNERFTAEWLFAFPEGKRRKLYERTNGEITFGASLKGQKKILAELMRPNSLFLSTATQNDHEELSVVRRFFADIKINESIAVRDTAVNSTFSDTEIDPRTIAFLGRVGTGVTGYRKLAEEMNDTSRVIMREIGAVMRKHLGAEVDLDNDNVKRVSIELAHQARGGEPCYFDLDRESAGTRRLLLMVNAAFKALDSGSLLVVDEVDASLHTYASEAILALFDNPEINENSAQLIATAHDTNLLASPFLGRDQIWFVEKDDNGASDLFSLAEVRSRPSDNFELGYLQGRYGGTIERPRRRASKRPSDLETVQAEEI